MDVHYPKASMQSVNPDISSSSRNSNNPERRLVVGFMVAKMLKAD